MAHTAQIVVPSGLELPSRRSLARAVVALIVAASGVALIALGVSFARSAPATRTAVALRTIPQGVSAQLIDGYPVIAVRAGEHVSLLDAYTTRGHLVAFCPSSPRAPGGVLVDPVYGSLWSTDGAKLGVGPAPRGLDRYDTTTDGDRLLVDVEHPQLGLAIGQRVPATSGQPIVSRVTPFAWTAAFNDANACGGI